MFKSEILNYINDRGFFKQCTDIESLDAEFNNNNKKTIYFGIDLTGKSLHVGHITGLMLCNIFRNFGHNIIILFGGATTMIGDPTGKDNMRKFMTEEEILECKKSISNNIEQFLNNKIEECNNIELGSITYVDNKDWFKDVKYIDILRDIGPHFSINKMLTMDSIKTRLDRNSPLSFLEFNYQILQSYDFYHLLKNNNCTIQIGGSDQWGNIIQGVNLINKIMPEKKVYGFTMPLITRSDGKKMGKTENGAIFINKNFTSIENYFQYFRNIDDNDIENFFYKFTILSINQIKEIKKIDINKAKEILAFEVTKICHGKENAEFVKQNIINKFTNNLEDLKDINEDYKISENNDLFNSILENNIVESKSEIKRLIEANGIKINNIAIDLKDNIINNNFKNKFSVINNKFLLQKGKKYKYIIKIQNE